MAIGLIRNARLVMPDGVYDNYSILINNEKIIDIDTNINYSKIDWQIDVEGDYLITGLIDTHIHGAGGSDTMDATVNGFNNISRTLIKYGTCGYCATTMSANLKKLDAVLSNIDALPALQGAQILGVHLEGPFISSKYKGAQSSANISVNVDQQELDELLKKHASLIKILTFAPEHNDCQIIMSLAERYKITLSAGHSEVDYDTMRRLSAKGLRRVTHTFNAMPALHHRAPGLLAASLTNDDITIELIGDKIHIHPVVLKIALALKPLDKVCLVSDGTRAVGMPDGEYELGGQQIKVKNGTSILADGTLAGSACPLLQGVKTLVNDLACPLHTAVNYASLNPAKTLGLEHLWGSIAKGKYANLIRLSNTLDVKQVWLKGTLVWEDSTYGLYCS